MKALSEKEIKTIKELYKFPQYTQKKLAQMYFVSPRTISNYLKEGKEC